METRPTNFRHQSKRKTTHYIIYDSWKESRIVWSWKKINWRKKWSAKTYDNAYISRSLSGRRSWCKERARLSIPKAVCWHGPLCGLLWPTFPFLLLCRKRRFITNAVLFQTAAAATADDFNPLDYKIFVRSSFEIV